MSLPRASGVLLHITSLPGGSGIGSLGTEAYRWVDFLVESGQRLWEVLPLGPTGDGNSPYGCLSAFAGNPLLIGLETLAEENLLDVGDVQGAALSQQRVDYGRVKQWKTPLLRQAFAGFEERAPRTQRDAFRVFCDQHAFWLDVYALFMALREAHDSAPWYTWEEGLRRRRPEALQHWAKELAQECLYHQFLQFQFFHQWSELKRYCHRRGVRIVGDIAHFVAPDSADVWWHQGLFALEPDGTPAYVAGVPPDYFSRAGQLWGNPVYRWQEMAQDGYTWWVARFRATYALVDLVRIDHFRGFEKYWEVPSRETTAVRGRWVPGPGAHLFQTLQKALGTLPVIAEDLGVITPEVDSLREQFAFPGVRVLQFAFGGGDGARRHQPHNYPRNCVVYTGTHDNDTTVGWFGGQDEKDVTEEKQLALQYVGSRGGQINWDFIRLALASVADTAIIPLQDVLGLGSSARMNLPGTDKGNWEWRFTSDMLSDGIKSRLGNLTQLYGR